MNRLKDRMIGFLSQKKVMKCIDVSILVVAVCSLILILIGGYYIKILGKEAPVNMNTVALFMMSFLILCYALKFFVSERVRLAVQMIMLVLILMALSGFVAIAKKILLKG